MKSTKEIIKKYTKFSDDELLNISEEQYGLLEKLARLINSLERDKKLTQIKNFK